MKKETWLASLATILLFGCNQVKETKTQEKYQLGHIIGEDNREVVRDTTILPYRAVGRISGFGSGTGTLIHKNIVLTAAHVASSYATFFVPARQNQDKPYGRFEIKEIVYPKKYAENGCLQEKTSKNKFYCFHYDFAFVVLKENIGERLGTLELSAVDENLDWELAYNAIGYGADNSFYQKSQNKDCTGAIFWGQKSQSGLAASAGPVAPHDEIAPIILNNCDGKSGDSGSPLLTYDILGGAYPSIAGIQVTANTDEVTPDWENYPDKDSSEFYSEALYGATAAIPAQVIIPEFKKLVERLEKE